MTIPIKWERVTTPSPSHAPAGPRPGEAVRNLDRRISPHTPSTDPKAPDRIWFLGDIYQVQTHYTANNTVPCIGGDCPLCGQQNARTNGYAAVLLKNGFWPEGDERWVPRVLRVFQSNFALGSGLRNRVYEVKPLTGRGNRREWTYTFLTNKRAPIPEFDVPAVMASYWFPNENPPVYLDGFRVAPPARPAPETAVSPIKSETTEQLLASLVKLRETGMMRSMLVAIEQELDARGVPIPEDPMMTKRAGSIISDDERERLADGHPAKKPHGGKRGAA